MATEASNARIMQRKRDLIFGYIREIETLSSGNSFCQNMTDDLKKICISYMYWFQKKALEPDSMIKHRFLHFYIQRQASLLEENAPVMEELINIMIARFSMFPRIVLSACAHCWCHDLKEHLVKRGFLNPHFLERMISDPSEILRFIRQQRAVVGDQLTNSLSPKKRPTISQLKLWGIL